MNLYERLFRTFNGHGVRYLVVGGVAVNLYGIERSTWDVDLLVDLEEPNLKNLITAAGELDLVPRAPVDIDLIRDADTRHSWIVEKGMVAFTLNDKLNPWFQVDILIHEPVNFSERYLEKEEMDLEGTKVPVASIDTLIAMKEGTNRPQDEADTIHLRRILETLKDE